MNAIDKEMKALTEALEMSFEKKVWDTLHSIDIKDYTKKRGDFDYLPWAAAKRILMEYFPQSTESFINQQPAGDESGWEVICEVTVKEGDNEMTRQMDLPVMDFRNNAIVKPDARAISDTRRRCYVKCLAAQFGLGLSLWDSEIAIPEREVSYTEDQLDRFNDYIALNDCYQLYLMSKEVQERVWIDLYNSFPKGTKTENKKKVNEMLDLGHILFTEQLDTLKEGISQEDPLGTLELVDAWADFEKRFYWKHLDKLERDYVLRVKKEAA